MNSLITANLKRFLQGEEVVAVAQENQRPPELFH